MLHRAEAVMGDASHSVAIGGGASRGISTSWRFFVSLVLLLLSSATCLRNTDGYGRMMSRGNAPLRYAFIAQPHVSSPPSPLKRSGKVLTTLHADGRATVLGDSEVALNIPLSIFRRQSSNMRGARTALFSTKVEGGGRPRHAPASLESKEDVSRIIDDVLDEESALDEEMDLTRDEVMEIILENQKLLSSIVESRAQEGGGKEKELQETNYSVKELEQMDDDALEDVFERVVSSLESLTPREQMLAEVLADPSLLPDNLRSPEKLSWLRREATLAEIEEVFDQYYAAEDDNGDDVDDDDDGGDDEQLSVGEQDSSGNDVISTYNPKGETLSTRYGLTRESAIELILENTDLIKGYKKITKASLGKVDEPALLALIDDVVTGFDEEMDDKGKSAQGEDEVITS